jgi:hypothetical protein
VVPDKGYGGWKGNHFETKKLLYYETGINYNWLLTGEGEMYNKGQDTPEPKKLEEGQQPDLEERLASVEDRLAVIEELLSTSKQTRAGDGMTR